MKPAAIETWHRLMSARDSQGLDRLLADDVVFQSPVVHTPQVGKAITRLYLTAAMEVLGNEAFRYVGEWFGPTSGVLEFETEIDGIKINGIDMIGWNDADQITSFKVMVRPLKAINKLHAMMGALLNEMTAKG
ncbi:MAG: nuclear transport factor 2 family protein [Parvibaculum sp.]|uniref:nuclear transport factor 2 family protein n=1 Tax=Parvibaculum sp. TaxID=2024848 RepID=UPI0025E71947|nr:nuclear transport factor 2 family protein [Parvibaculum sp.]MCE9648821.1 nuclear transport factor 2 family protein [Parvibaculum sp.]